MSPIFSEPSMTKTARWCGLQTGILIAPSFLRPQFRLISIFLRILREESAANVQLLRPTAPESFSDVEMRILAWLPGSRHGAADLRPRRRHEFAKNRRSRECILDSDHRKRKGSAVHRW